MTMNRTQVDYRYYGSEDHDSSERTVRVNLYGAAGILEEELDNVKNGLNDHLVNCYFNNTTTGIDGYDLYVYNTDVTLEQTISEGHDDLIDKGYNAIDGSYDDEHSITFWAYWNHEADASTCGPNSDPCPDVFTMGHDINHDAAYPAYHRQPYVHIEPLNTDLYDIHQGFVYTNSNEGTNAGPPAAHELAHTLIDYNGYQSENLTPNNPSQNRDHYIGTRVEQYIDQYNTLMATANNPEAVTDGQCNDSESANSTRIVESDCYWTAIEQTIQYYRNNVSGNI